MCPMCLAATAWAVVGATSAGGAVAFVTAKLFKSRAGRKAAAFILGKLRGVNDVTATGRPSDSAIDKSEDAERPCCVTNSL